MKHPIHLIALLWVLSGCTDSTGPTRSLSIVVGKPTYSLSADQSADVSLTNTSGVDVFFPMNTYVECERLVAGEWTFGARWFELVDSGAQLSGPEYWSGLLAPLAAATVMMPRSRTPFRQADRARSRS